MQILTALVAFLAAVMGGELVAATYIGTLAPTKSSVDSGMKLHSYFCLEKEQRLCLGISTDGDPVYNAYAPPYKLQVKVRDKNEAKGLDYQKMRWAVDRVNGRIQLSNFTTLCASKQSDTTTVPGEVILKPCGTTGPLEVFDLKEFLANANEQGVITLKRDPKQCLTMMVCERASPNDPCNQDLNKVFSGSTIDVDIQRGAFVKFMPCLDKKKSGFISQSWRQALDCAPGCSPFMMKSVNGERNTCDPECANDQCNWDNGACATPRPTPPTHVPSKSPSKSPSTSRPTKSPSRSPSTSRPSKAPSRSPSTSKPTKSPSSSPSVSPSTSIPSLAPTTSPSRSPSAQPTHSPTKSPTSGVPTPSPTDSPSRAPTSSPTVSPSVTSPSVGPTSSPTVQPSMAPTINKTLPSLEGAAPVQTQDMLWIWILIGVICYLFLMLVLLLCYYRDRRRRRQQEEERRRLVKERSLLDIENNAVDRRDESSKMNRPPPPIPTRHSEPEPTVRMPSPVPIAKAEESNHLVTIDLDPVEDRESVHAGAPGLLWNGSHEDLTEMDSSRADLRRRSERFTREQLSEVLNQRSFVTAPLEKVHEGEAQAGEDNTTALSDPAMEYREPPSAVQPVNVEDMSTLELKSFIVENGGSLEGNATREQLITRARELAE